MRRLVSMSPSSKDSFGGDGSSLLRVLGSTRIDEIWFFDNCHQGQSLDLNKGLLGPVHSWFDAGRDIANFIKHILPSTTGLDGQSMSETLSWAESYPSRTRKVLGLGHSSGGNHMFVSSLDSHAFTLLTCSVRAAHLHPELFDAIFLVDPMVNSSYPPLLIIRYPLYTLVLLRSRMRTGTGSPSSGG